MSRIFSVTGFVRTTVTASIRETFPERFSHRRVEIKHRHIFPKYDQKRQAALFAERQGSFFNGVMPEIYAEKMQDFVMLEAKSG